MHNYKCTFRDCHYKSAQMLNDAKIKALVLVSTVISGVKEMIFRFAFLQIIVALIFIFILCRFGYSNKIRICCNVHHIFTL